MRPVRRELGLRSLSQIAMVLSFCSRRFKCMAIRSNVSRPRGHGAKRLMQWGLGVGDTAATSFSSTSAALLGSAVTFGAAGTVVRMRGRLTALLKTVAAVGNGF